MNSSKALVNGNSSSLSLEPSSSSSEQQPSSKRSSLKLFSNTWKFIKSLKKIIKGDNDSKKGDDDDDNDDDDYDNDDDVVYGDDDTKIATETPQIESETRLTIALNEIDNLCQGLIHNDIEYFAYSLHDIILYLLQFDNTINVIISLDEVAEFVLTLLNNIDDNNDNKNNDNIYAIILTITNELMIQNTKTIYDNNDNNDDNININLKTVYDLLKWYGWWSNTIMILTIKLSLSLNIKSLEVLSSLLDKKLSSSYNSIIIMNDHINYLCDMYLFGLPNNDNNKLVGASINLSDKCCDILLKFFTSPTTYLMQHNDDSLYTTLTVTIWELIHINLELTKESKITILTTKTITSIITILTFVLHHLASFASLERKRIIANNNNNNNNNDNKNLPQSKVIVNNSPGIMLDVILALTNDCAIQMNELVTVINDHGNDNNDISDLVSELVDTLTKTGTSILNEVAIIITNKVMKDNDNDATDIDMLLVITTMNKYIPFILHKLLPFWTEKLLVLLYESFMGIFLRSIITRKTYDNNNSIKILKNVQNEFKFYYPNCVSDSDNDAMIWILNLFHNISINNNNNVKKLLKQCPTNDASCLHEALKTFCSRRGIPTPTIDISNKSNTDTTNKQNCRNIIQNISSKRYIDNSTIVSLSSSSSLLLSIKLDKFILQSSLRDIPMSNKNNNNNKNKTKTNADSYKNVTITVSSKPKSRRWSRVKNIKNHHHHDDHDVNNEY